MTGGGKMKFCEKCKVSVRGDHERCPLCNGVLSGAPVPSGFPRLQNLHKERKAWMSILALASVAGVVACMVINFLLPQGGPWSLFVLGGVACMWLTLGLVMYKRRNIPKTLVWEVFLVSALAVVWDLSTGWRGWSIDYVMPIVCMGVMVTLSVFARLFRVPSGSFIVYICVDALLGVIQLALLLTRLVTVPLPSLLSTGLCIVTIAALFLFRGKNAKEELKRRLHL